MKIGPLELSDTSLTHHGVLYMRRWAAEVPWLGGVRLHYIAGPDPGPYPHDHPFDFVSFVLRGWYVEENQDHWRFHVLRLFGRCGVWLDACFLERRRWLSVAARYAEHTHRIVEVAPGGCWTLVVSGRRRRTWGYVTAHGWIDFLTYLEDHEP
jgi:hypothetical protein